jgi:hypothetical protein
LKFGVSLLQLTSFFAILMNVDNDVIYDLISKKKLIPSENRKTEEVSLPGITLVGIDTIEEFEDALTLCLLNAKMKNGHLKSHLFIRLHLRVREEVQKNKKNTINASATHTAYPALNSPLIKELSSAQKSKHFANRTSTASNEISWKDSYVPLEVVLLAPFTSNENLTKEELSIKRSLLNMSHMIDNILGSSENIGMHWRSFKLTHLLKNSFTSNRKLMITVHTYGLRSGLVSALWSLTFGASARRIMEGNSAEISGKNQPPALPVSITPSEMTPLFLKRNSTESYVSVDDEMRGAGVDTDISEREMDMTLPEYSVENSATLNQSNAKDKDERSLLREALSNTKVIDFVQ